MTKRIDREGDGRQGISWTTNKFALTMKDLMDGIAAGKNPAPTFEEGYRCQAVLDAVERSAERCEWIRAEYGGL